MTDFPGGRLQEDHHEALQRELGIEIAKDEEEEEEEHAGQPPGMIPEHVCLLIACCVKPPHYCVYCLLCLRFGRQHANGCLGLSHLPETHLHCHSEACSATCPCGIACNLEGKELPCPVQDGMLLMLCRGAEDRADDEQAVAQETGPKPVLPVEKMLSKKACPIPSVPLLSEPTATRAPELAPNERSLTRLQLSV